MTTGDYALIVSIVSILIALTALIWNVWQKFIFVKPVLQASFGVWTVTKRQGNLAVPTGKKLLLLSVTNMGPGPVMLSMCVSRSRRRSYRGLAADALNPIHGDATEDEPRSLGPYSGGLPLKIDAADTKEFYFPYGRDCLLAKDVVRVGISDTYRRIAWCRRSDMKEALRAYRKDFEPAKS